MGSVSRGLLLFPRPDLCSPLVEVVEWSLRAHDATRLWGIQSRSTFHPEPKGVWVRQFGTTEAPAPWLEAIYEGCVDFAWQLPPGRKLEDRVLDLLRVVQSAGESSEVDPRCVRLLPPLDGSEPDELVIVEQLLQSGFCSLP